MNIFIFENLSIKRKYVFLVAYIPKLHYKRRMEFFKYIVDNIDKKHLLEKGTGTWVLRKNIPDKVIEELYSRLKAQIQQNCEVINNLKFTDDEL